jgi:SAM-dependent methyltransferase
MIRIKNNNCIEGGLLDRKAYYEGKSLFTQMCMQITKRLRARQVLRLMDARHAHLDIGCGDGYFLKKTKCAVKYGADARYGDHITDAIGLPDEFFDYVTMLAVIEHLEKPESIFCEIYRILKKNGRFIFTTPKKHSETVIKFYAKSVAEDHLFYFDKQSIQRLAGTRFKLVYYKPFLLGLNQVFCLQKTDV